MNKVTSEGFLQSLNKVSHEFVSLVWQENVHKKPFGKTFRVTYTLDLIHCNVLKPMNVKVYYGASSYYHLTIHVVVMSIYYLTIQKYKIASNSFVLTVDNQKERKEQLQGLEVNIIPS